ncbi:DNA-binding NarL/FixJ family response regulator [Actinoplanes octamycinicus]|uniref:DNA-binding NarL/FixJ family response regulator n=1 Tax=Actinoplanes octamycinicus TaxID=135948 RepID=A0A7W7H0G2_9ACTN|nr:response regulator transcription factor [Actinoplanes octamycinicus]MBB4741710.1 DNA-binding NarL/FixJ family response regulator [Actinoplanes octamycinicus]GIE57263.1 DNA-binding response regulator [Actinoplanes octamycinicus]
MRTGIRVVVIDDHHLFVRGLELLLPEVSDGRAAVVASTGDAAYAASVARHAVPDLVLVDLHMPAPGGVRAIGAVRRAAPRARVLAMSGDDDPAIAIEALRGGATGFLPKSSDPADLLQPLLAAVDGWAVLPDQLLAVLTEQTRRTAAHPAATLSEPDRELLRLIAGGSSTVEMAATLHVSERTVKRLTAGLLRKLHVASRAEAAAVAGQAGLL